jgi:FkbM family methyltransferase
MAAPLVSHKDCGRNAVSEASLQKIILKFNTEERQFWCRPGSSDLAIFRDIFEKRAYDTGRLRRHAEIIAHLRTLNAAGKRPLVIDAGANAGASPLWFSYSVPRSRVVAIEPEPENFAMLLRNTAGRDIICLRAGLAGAPGRLAMADVRIGTVGFRTERSENGSVPAVTVSEIYERHCTGELVPFLVKIDIEGGEEDVFSHDVSWTRGTPIIVIEPHDWLLEKRGSFRPFLRSIVDEDRDFLIQGENIFAIAHDLGCHGRPPSDRSVA